MVGPPFEKNQIAVFLFESAIHHNALADGVRQHIMEDAKGGRN